MRYIDSGIREPEQVVAQWMSEVSATGPCEFRCQSGYFTIEGLGILAHSLKEWASLDKSTKLLVGSNAASTLASHVAYLAGWLAIPQDHVALGVIRLRNALFHPKVYHFVRADGSMCAYVGSANLTRQGISGWNVEAGVLLDTNDGDDPSVLEQIAENIDSWFNGERGAIERITSSEDIEKLIKEGHLALRRPKEDENDFGGTQGQSSRGSMARLDANATIFKMPDIPNLPDEFSDPKFEIGQSSKTKPQAHFRKTEASYHYPQGTHLGHILAVLYSLSGDRSKTVFADEFVRLDGSLGHGRLAAFRRQIKYKLLAAMEFGLVEDYRLTPPDEYVLSLTELGENLWELFAPLIDQTSIALADGDELSTKMPLNPTSYVAKIKEARERSPELASLYDETVLSVPSVQQMLALVRDLGTGDLLKSDIYENFFSYGPVVDFCDQHGIEPGTEESAKHRCPLLLNVLESVGLIDQSSNKITFRGVPTDG